MFYYYICVYAAENNLWSSNFACRDYQISLCANGKVIGALNFSAENYINLNILMEIINYVVLMGIYE